jgi:hypothetical protein
MKKIALLILACFCILSVNAQTVLTISGIDTTLTTDQGYNVPRTTPATLTFTNNRLLPTVSGGFTLQIGSDNSGSYDNNLDGAVVSGNLLYTSTAMGSHGMMAGYNINYHIKHNYIDGTPYGIVAEGDDAMAYTEGGVYYNIIKNNQTNCMAIGGTIGLPIYNNTFYSNRSSSSTSCIIRISYKSDNTIIKNNIFYATRNHYMINLDAESLATLDCDYNVYYVVDGDHQPTFRNSTSGATYTLAQWQALGHDEHSVVINPNFTDTINFAPSLRLNYGVDLIDSDYDYGLSPVSEWTVGSTPDLIKQDDDWQVGATLIPTDGDYFVATWGDNADAGTFNEPWATLQYAMSNVEAGDTVYLRGGTYAVTSAQAITSNPGLVGTEANPICFFNYPGETPIIDGSTKTSQSHGITLYYSSFVEFRGIHVQDHAQFETSSFPSAFNLYYCTDITFDRCVVANIGGRGFAGRWCSRFTYINCDAYNLDNNLTAEPGGDADGFFLSPSSHNFTGQHYFYGCRAWKCSDDGWDIENLGLIVVENCWAFNNGFEKYDDPGLGNGFKINLTPAENVSQLSRIFKNNIAAYNRRTGITTNDNVSGARWMHVYNNTSYANGLFGEAGYGFQVYPTNSSDANEEYRIFRNNIAYANTTLDFRLATGAVCTQDNNSWNGGVTVTNADFISVDSTGLTGTRQEDGSLPNLSFLKLAATSDLIDAGTDVGLDYSGTAPDLGAFEFDSDDIDSTLTDILTFTLPTQTGAATINTTAHTVAIEVAYTADVTDLTPTITLSYGATVSPLSGVSQDFTSPVTYTVTALDGTTTQEWVVTVTQEAAPATRKRIVLNGTRPLLYGTKVVIID